MSNFAILNQLPKGKVGLAVSGGPDSMAMLDFISRNTLRKVTVLMFDHNTGVHKHAEELVTHYLGSRGLEHEVKVGTISRDKNADESWEEYWRNERYKFLHSFDFPVLTAHNLDDCVETWLWKCSHGSPSVIPYRNKNVIRPFLLTKKSSMVDWCNRYDVPYWVDPSNLSNNYMRGIMRNDVIPAMLRVNPGLYTCVSGVVLKQCLEYENV